MYVTATGRRFTLAHHNLIDWATRVRSDLLALGCSTEYAEAEFTLISEAVRA